MQTEATGIRTVPEPIELGTQVMNGVFDSVEMQMLEELAKKGAITNKRFSYKKKYLKELVRRLYLNL